MYFHWLRSKLEFLDRRSRYKILHDTNHIWKWNSIYALQWFNMVWKDFNGIFEVLSKTLWIETAHRINHTIPCTYVNCKQLLKHSRSQVFFSLRFIWKLNFQGIMSVYPIFSLVVVTIMIFIVASILSCFVYYIYLNYKNFRQSTRANDIATSNSVLERTPNQAVSKRNCHASTISVSTSRLSSEDFHYIHTEV